MSYIERQLNALAQQQRTDAQNITDEALETYLAIKPEVRHAARQYATKNRINFSTAIAEACRSYFVQE